MGILRDVIARFSIAVDSKPLTDLDKQLKKTKETVNAVGTQAGVAFAAMGYGAFELVQMASHATENLNVLHQTFKNDEQAVIDWSKTMGKALGRSTYQLQEYAGRFGSFLAPVFAGTDADIAKMSEDLSGLAVDLASFYDTSEEEAMMRLFSGMSGETEAVRRLGIDISDTSLDALNKSNGDPRRLASLSLQEKTALRLQKIQKDTLDKQGDAVRTAGDLANTFKRLKGQAFDLGTEMGKKLIPATKDLLHIYEEYLGPMLTDLGMETNAIQHAFELAGGAAIALAGGFALNNTALLMNSLILGGLMLAFDELRGAAEGSKTALDKLAGKEEGETGTWTDTKNVGASVIGHADVGWATLVDAVAFMSGDFAAVGDAVEAAKARRAANTSGEGYERHAEQLAFNDDKRKAELDRNPDAYVKAFTEHGRVLPDDTTAGYMAATKKRFEAGDERHVEQDAANGVAPAGATSGFNAVKGKREAYRGVGSVLQPGAIQINMYGDNNEQKVADHLGVMLRQANATVGDEASQNPGKK